jgi:hypothetical protein
LADCVNAGVSPPGRMGHCSAAEETLENPLEFDLDRAAGWLALPPDKAGAVIV